MEQQNREQLIISASPYTKIRESIPPSERLQSQEIHSKEIKEISHTMAQAAGEFRQLSQNLGMIVKEFSNLTGEMQKFTQQMERSSKKVDEDVEKVADRFKKASESVSRQMKEAFKSFTEEGEKAVGALGSVGRAITGIGAAIMRLGGQWGSAIGGVISGALMISLSANLMEREVSAALHRIGLALFQYLGLAQEAPKVVKDAFHHMEFGWRIGKERAEAFFTSLAGIGRTEIWKSGEELKKFSDLLMNMSVAAGVGEQYTIKTFGTLYRMTDMTKGGLSAVTQALKEIYAAGKESAEGVVAFVDTLFKGIEGLRIFGPELGMVKEGAKTLSLVFREFSPTLGMEGARRTFEVLTGVSRTIIGEPGRLLWALGREVTDRPFTELLRTAEILRTQSPIMPFVYELMRLRREGLGSEELGMKIVTEIAGKVGGVPNAAIVAKAIMDNLDKLSKGGEESKDALNELNKVWKQYFRESIDPMQALKMIMQEGMLHILPGMHKVITGLLQAIISGIAWLGATIMKYVPFVKGISSEAYAEITREFKESLQTTGEGFKEIGKGLKSIYEGLREEFPGQTVKDYLNAFNSLRIILEELGISDRQTRSTQQQRYEEVPIPNQPALQSPSGSSYSSSREPIVTEPTPTMSIVPKRIEPGRITWTLSLGDIMYGLYGAK